MVDSHDLSRMKCAAQVDVKDDKGCTPTIMAALNGHLKTVELLVDRFKAKASYKQVYAESLRPLYYTPFEVIISIDRKHIVGRLQSAVWYVCR